MIETLLAGALVSIAKRLGEKWVDVVADRLDGQVRDVLSSVAGNSSRVDGEAVETATAQVEKFLVAHPDAAADVVEATLHGRSPLPRIDRMAAFLDIVAAVAASLRRPLALPGFFNSELSVLVVDARTRDGRPSPAMLETASAIGDPESRSMFFENDSARDLSLARYWLLQMPSADRRDVVVSALNDRFETDGPDQWFLAFETKALDYGLPELESPQPLTRLTRDRVYVEQEVAGVASGWYAIRGPDGTQVLRDAVIRLADSQARKDREIDEALNPAFGSGR